MTIRILLVAFLTIPGLLLSENRPSKPELLWGLAHPFAALKIKKISQQCHHYYDSLAQRGIPDRYASGGKLDALRHVYFMAAFAQKINAGILKKLGEAHELGNRQQFLKRRFEEAELSDSVSCEMDLYNNLIGIEIGKNAPHITLSVLLKRVLKEIEVGNAVIMNRNKKGEYLTCTNERIVFANYADKWKIPKCLVKSNTQAKD